MKQERLVFLDGCRVMPAVVVMLGHATAPFQPDPWPLSGLAVDFFFVLGAFVIMQAYAGRVLAGMGFMAFMAARLKRLFPLYLAGLLLGLVLFALKDGIGPDAVVSFILNLFFLPTPYSLAEGWSSGIVFNQPGWTLLFQFLANAVWWLVLVRLSVPLKWLACALLGVLNIVQIQLSGDLWGGEFFENAYLGVLRALFPFTLGVCLWHVWQYRPGIAFRGWTGTCLAIGLCGVLLATFVAPDMPGDGNVWLKVAAITVIFPAVIHLGARIELRGRVAKVFAFAGYISYGLYITHYFVVRVMSVAWRGLAMDEAWLMPWYALELVVSIALAWFATRYFETPLREGLQALGKRWRAVTA